MTGTPNTPSAASPSVPAERVTTYGYTPGRALAVCGARVAVLVDLPPDAGLVAGLYELVRLPEAGLDEVLELLISPGLRAIQQFALAEPTDEGLRLVVRGGYRAVAGAHTITGRGLWTDRIVTVDSYTLIDSDTVGAMLPLADGVVLAAQLNGRVSAGDGWTTGSIPSAAIAAEDAALLSLSGGSAAGGTASDPTGDTPAANAPAGEPSTGEASTGGPPAGEPQTGEPPAGEAPAGPAAKAQPATEVGTSPASPVPLTPPAEPVAPTPVTDDPDEGGTGHTLPSPFTSPLTTLPPVTPLPAPALPPAPPTAALAPPGQADDERPTFIDSLPWSTPPVHTGPSPTPAAATPPAPGSPPPATAHSTAPAATQPMARGLPASEAAADRTISRDQLPRETVQTVVAVRCSEGHLSPAHAGACRVCGRPIPTQQPVEIPRPPLGVLRLSNGDTVVLDRACVLGRNPRVPPGLAGEQPNLVRLIDPDKDISGQHLEVRLDYWHVAVTDLGSTNGTQVVLPGESPVTLRPNDPMMIEPGTKVILAGVFSFTFEVTP